MTNVKLNDLIGMAIEYANHLNIVYPVSTFDGVYMVLDGEIGNPSKPVVYLQKKSADNHDIYNRHMTQRVHPHWLCDDRETLFREKAKFLFSDFDINVEEISYELILSIDSILYPYGKDVDRLSRWLTFLYS